MMIDTSSTGTSLLSTSDSFGALAGASVYHHCKSELFCAAIDWYRDQLARIKQKMKTRTIPLTVFFFFPQFLFSLVSLNKKKEMLLVSVFLICCVISVAAGAPTPVFIDLKMLLLEKVDGVEQTFDTDFTMMYSYPTPINNTGWPPGLYPLLPHMLSVNQFIEPHFPYSHGSSSLVSNDLFQSTDLLPWLAGKTPIGTAIPTGVIWIMVARRYRSRFKVDLPLHDFPFDRQSISITMRLRLPTTTIMFGYQPQSNFTQLLSEIVQWTAIGHEITEAIYVPAGIAEEYHELNFIIHVQRDPAYYMNKIVNGIVLLVVMNLLLFLLDPGDSNRHSVAATLFLAIVAYLFLVSNDVPKISYSTRLDRFIFFSMVHIFGGFVLFAAMYYAEKWGTNLRRLDELREIRRLSSGGAEDGSRGEKGGDTAPADPGPFHQPPFHANPFGQQIQSMVFEESANYEPPPATKKNKPLSLQPMELERKDETNLAPAPPASTVRFAPDVAEPSPGFPKRQQRTSSFRRQESGKSLNRLLSFCSTVDDPQVSEALFRRHQSSVVLSDLWDMKFEEEVPSLGGFATQRYSATKVPRKYQWPYFWDRHKQKINWVLLFIASITYAIFGPMILAGVF